MNKIFVCAARGFISHFYVQMVPTVGNALEAPLIKWLKWE